MRKNESKVIPNPWNKPIAMGIYVMVSYTCANTRLIQ